MILFTNESLAIMFYSKHVESKDISMKPLKIIKRTVRNAIYSKTQISLHHAISIILMAWKMAEADWGPSRDKRLSEHFISVIRTQS